MENVSTLEAKVSEISEQLQKHVAEFEEATKNIRSLRAKRKQILRTVNVLDGAGAAYQHALSLVKPAQQVIPAGEAQA
jgi:uncharacterized coiled-coil DUF342 family protein